MIARGMVGWRNPARYLAPLAIAAVAAAAYAIVHHAVAHKHTSVSTSLTAPATTVRTSRSRRSPTKAKFYVVRPNDTLSTIAARTGVSLGAIEALNPNVNPDTLHPQQRLRLRR
jgi:LysM repeat protein